MVAILETIEIKQFKDIDFNCKGKFELSPVYAHPYEIKGVSRISKLSPTSKGVVLGHKGNIRPMNSNNESIGKRHAILNAEYNKGKRAWYIRNLNKNGTSVNGKTIADDDAVLLESGDIISIPSAQNDEHGKPLNTKFESFIFED
jgi:hypothetical protein